MIERLLFARLPVWAVILLTMLTLAVGGVWSWGVVVHNVYPAAPLRELQAFLRGVPGDERSLWTRLISSQTYLPRAFPASHDHTVLPADAFAPVRPAADAAAPLPHLDGMRIANPGGETRYFVVFGSFAFDEMRTDMGVIAIDSTGRVHRAWPERVQGGRYRGLHIGMAVTDDGVIATTAKGVLNAQSWCGEALWQAPLEDAPDGVHRDPNALDGTDWHHDVAHHDGTFWTFVGPAIAAVDAATGEVVQTIHAVDMMRWSWNQGLALMDGGTGLFNPNGLNKATAVHLLPRDPFHFNKVEPLPAELAPLYPGLEAGDLLVSMRSSNLVAVLRPSQQRFVWWRLGMTSRAHDATFIDGDIEVFNNAPFTAPPAPTIRRLDFDDPRGVEDIFQLDQFGMVMRQKGNFERDGDRLLTVDDDAGRMIAADMDGTLQVVFENGHDNGEDVVNLQLRNATEIAPETFARLQASCR